MFTIDPNKTMSEEKREAFEKSFDQIMKNSENLEPLITNEEIQTMLDGLDAGREKLKAILNYALWYDEILDTQLITREYHDAAMSDKDAVIGRLKEKLEVTGEVMQKNADLENETIRLHSRWHKAEETCNVFRNQVDQLIKERDAWKEEAKVLQHWKDQALVINTGWDEVDAYIRNHKNATIGDYVHIKCLEWLKERDKIKAFLDSIPKI